MERAASEREVGRRGEPMRGVLVRTEDCRRLLERQQGKTQEVKSGGEILHRSGHSVNGVIDLVFVGIQSFSSIHVVPQILHCLFHVL